jgi:hypothetical protein
MNMPTARIPMSNVQKAAHAGADMNMPTARIPMSNVQKAAHAGADMNMPTARILNAFKTVISEKEKQLKYEYVSYSDWITK